MRALAALYEAIHQRRLYRPSELPNRHGDEVKSSNINNRTIVIDGLFPKYEPFMTATLALIRFGFIQLVSAFGGNNIVATERLFDFLEQIDISRWNSESEHGVAEVNR